MDEHARRINKYKAKMEQDRQEEMAKHKQTIKDFKLFASSKGIELRDEHIRYSPPTGLTADFPGILRILDSELDIDKDGLIDLNKAKLRYKSNPFAHGQLVATNYIAFAHPHFRRNFHDRNNFAPRFIELFWAIKQSSLQSYIALDMNRVRISVDDSSYIELDTWYGSKFNRDISQIKNEVAKLRPPIHLDEFTNDMLFHGAYCLDVRWETEGRKKIFKAEEFKTEKLLIEKNGAQYHPVRYIHAEFDFKEKAFCHFDGAIHYYEPDEYFGRRDSDLNYDAKSSKPIKALSEKLFKLNGPVLIDDWINLVSHFMTGNALVHEYFEGKYPDWVEQTLNVINKGNDFD